MSDVAVWAVLAVAVGGGVGALLRHLAATSAWGPLRAVFVMNVLGSAGLGTVLSFADRWPSTLVLALGTGLCGALTTYSTVAVQTWELWTTDRARATAYLGGTTVAAVAAALLPMLLLT